MIRKIGHIGIAVENLEDGIHLYGEILGLDFVGTEEVSDQGVKVAMFNAGDVRIELLEPTSVDSPVGKFIAKKGPGVHHLCFEVDDVDEALETLSGRGVRLIDRESRRGAEGMRTGFLHPESTMRVLIELSSRQRD